MEQLIRAVEGGLLPQLLLQSRHPYEPVSVLHVPEPWQLLGAGNYAAVVYHPEHPDLVVKVYAPGRHGLEQEAEVYRKLGEHPAYSACYYADRGKSYLILKRLHGHTMYDCLRLGIRIPEQVIRDIDEALQYAKERGLFPQDVHGKNVMVDNGRGKVVDVSDFLQQEACSMWSDMKKAYYRLYVPLLSRWPVPIPDFAVNWIRKGYRLWRSRKLPARTSRG